MVIGYPSAADHVQARKVRRSETDVLPLSYTKKGWKAELANVQITRNKRKRQPIGISVEAV